MVRHYRPGMFTLIPIVGSILFLFGIAHILYNNQYIFLFISNKPFTDSEKKIATYIHIPTKQYEVLQYKIQQNKKIITLDDPESIRYFSIKNEANSVFPFNLVINNKNFTTLKGIVNSVITEEMTDKEKADALFEFVSHFVLSVNSSELPYMDTLTILNIWGKADCAYAAALLAKLAQTAGLESKVTYTVNHSVAEIYYDDAWHMFDVNNHIVIFDKKNTAASADEVFFSSEYSDLVEPFGVYSIFDLKTGEKIEILDAYSPKPENGVFTISLNPLEEIRFYANNYTRKHNIISLNYRQIPIHDKPDTLQGFYIHHYIIPKNKILFHFFSYITSSMQIPFLMRTIFPLSEIKTFTSSYPIKHVYISGENICSCAESIKILINNDIWTKSDLCANNILDFSDPFRKDPAKPIYQYKLKNSCKNIDYFSIMTEFHYTLVSFPNFQKGKNIFSLLTDIKEHPSLSITIGY